MLEERMEDHLEDEIENEETEYEEEFCFYCGEPLDDGMCSAACHESEEDEGRECECDSF